MGMDLVREFEISILWVDGTKCSFGFSIKPVIEMFANFS